MTMYKIDKNVEVPRKGKWMILQEEMEEGDSVLFDKHDEARSFRASIHRIGGRAIERATSEGFRVWMIKKPNNQTK